ncbi:ATP-binding protein [Dyadobacter sp. 676]|uniref:ATP-binding protein n=1 Tax=Dyadobacter sp. 676 TaxID=3088362 RepID=A0AAU8FLQ5_9BACT
MKKPIEDQISQYSKELRLPALGHHFKEVARQSASEGAGYETFLLRLMQIEYEKRIENRKGAAIRQAGFPARMYLSELEKQHLPSRPSRNYRCWSGWILSNPGKISCCPETRAPAKPI